MEACFSDPEFIRIISLRAKVGREIEKEVEQWQSDWYLDEQGDVKGKGSWVTFKKWYWYSWNKRGIRAAIRPLNGYPSEDLDILTNNKNKAARKMKVIGMCGSLRKDSFNKVLLERFQKAVPLGTSLSILDYSDVPVFNQDHESPPPQSVHKVKQTISEADALLIVSPEYNGSVPGPLKNLIDWCTRPYGTSCFRKDLPIVIAGASLGPKGTAFAQKELCHIFSVLGCKVLNSESGSATSLAIPFVNESVLNSASVKDRVTQIWKLLSP